MYTIEKNNECVGPVELSIVVHDPLVCKELNLREEGSIREDYARTALSIGVMCLREASSRVDVEAVEDAGRQLIKEANDVVAGQGRELIGQISDALGKHFDPKSGLLPARIEALVREDGDLEKVLEKYVGRDNSFLASSLAQYLGEQSAIFKMLSPTEQQGLIAQLQKILQGALNEQRQQILREFSLDNKESALCRFLKEINLKQGELSNGLAGKIDRVVKEFSLDEPSSALSRLVGRVERAHKAISDEFSTDNDSSALNKLSGLLQKTNAQIDCNLSLDNESSALYRMKKEIEKSLESIAQSNAQFHVDVKAAISALEARKAESERSTRHGVVFEEELGQVLDREARRLEDVLEGTGAKSGNIAKCRKGDFLVELGAETVAAGARIVWEAKEDKSYDLKKALSELDEAMKNRGAQIGIFVFSRKTAPEGMECFSRYGNRIVIVWDAEDASTDLMVRLSYSMARALVVRESRVVNEIGESIREITQATICVEKQVNSFDELQKWGETIKNNGEKILGKVAGMRKELVKAVEQLNLQIDSLKTAQGE